MRILVVKDERRIAAFIKRGLEEECYVVGVAYDFGLVIGVLVAACAGPIMERMLFDEELV